LTTTIKQNESIIYTRAQAISFNLENQYICRADERDNANASAIHSADLCDYVKGDHQKIPYLGACSTVPLAGPLNSTIEISKNVTAYSKFRGKDSVGGILCKHWGVANVPNPNFLHGFVDVDFWFQDDNPEWPCQLVVQDPHLALIFTWSFTAFTTTVEAPNKTVCAGLVAPMCDEADWECHPKPGTPDSRLASALSWICGGNHINCAPINPGGAHYLPNTPIDHANWAFNAYYQIYKAQQATGACDFQGMGILVPPSKTRHFATKQKFPTDLPYKTPYFDLDLVCITE